MEEILERFRQAARVFVALDFDGTLAPIVERPEDARLPPETLALLHELNRRDNLTLAIVSGRSVDDLRRRLDLSCIYVGNHGLEIDGPGLAFRHPTAEAIRPSLICVCDALDGVLASVEGAFVERKGLTATVHYRRTPEHARPALDFLVRHTLQPYVECLSIVPALEAWEVRPRVDWDKGAAVEFVMGMGKPRPLLICAGDDVADEDMFTAVPDAISIRVGCRAGTAARYCVADPAGLAALLAVLPVS